jgi:uncharacterized protein YqfA (UPF0365 family)
VNNAIGLIVAAVMALVFLAFLAVLFPILRLWLQALLTGTPVSFAEIIQLRLTNLPLTTIVHAAIALHQRGVKVPLREVAACYLKHGVGREMNATQLATLVVAQRADSTKPPQT